MATSTISIPIAETVLSSPHTIASNTGLVMRYGKIVNLSARITITSDVSAWTAFASVPEGFRPYEVQCNLNNLGDPIYLAVNGDLQCSRNLTANEVMVISFTYYTK